MTEGCRRWLRRWRGLPGAPEDRSLDLPDIRMMEIGCIIGTHVGPDLTLAAWIQA